MRIVQYCAFFNTILYVTFLCSGSIAEPTTVAFDIHNVLVVPDKPIRDAAIKQIIINAASSIISDMGRAPFGYAGERRPYALFGRLTQLLYMGDISGEGFATVCEQYGYPELSAQVKAISLAYDPVPYMEKVIEELKSNGVHVMVASNIGSQFYQLLANKNDDTKALFGQFDEQDPGVTVEFVRADGTIVHKPIKKPNADYFRQVLQKARDKGSQRAIFLDDNKAYVEQARKAGLEAFWFDARKHHEHAAEFLRAKLIARNVLPQR